MASTNSQKSYKPYITNGLITKRRYNTPKRSLIVGNIIRLIQINQVAELALQTTLDGWTTSLTAIPNNRFFIGGQYDFNDLACNVLYTSTTTSEGNAILNKDLEISLIASVEQHIDPQDIFKRSESILTCYEAILDTYFAIAEPELKYDYENATSTPAITDFLKIGIENPLVTGFGIAATSSLPGISAQRKALGFLPTLNIKVTLLPSTN